VRSRIDEVKQEGIVNLSVDEKPVAFLAVNVTFALSEASTFKRVILEVGWKRNARSQQQDDRFKQ